MFVEYDLYGPDILTLNNMNYDKSTGVREYLVFHVTSFSQSDFKCGVKFMTPVLF